MKYEYYPKRRTEQERRELNEQILRLLQSEACEQAGVTDEDIFNRYTGDGGLHGLRRSDYENYNAFSAAKKELENGQFFTPPPLCEMIVSALRLSDTDLVADLTCGMGNFFNFLPNERNAYGCEVDPNACAVARKLYPQAHIVQGDIRDYEPQTHFDVVLGNPPFHLRWIMPDATVMTSHQYYCLKAAKLLKPLGILAVIVPASFLADSFSDKGAIRMMESRFSFLGQVMLPGSAFSDSGVDGFPTKLQFWQKKSTAADWTSKRYSTDCSDIYIPSGHPVMAAPALYEKFVMVAKADLAGNRNKVFLELAQLKTTKSTFLYQVKKYLYQIRSHPVTREKYDACFAYVHRFYTQRQPADMPYEEWQRVQLTEAKVLAYLKQALCRQNAKPERDEIRLVKQKYSFVYKAYSRKMAKLLTDEMRTPVPIYQAVLNDEPERFPGYERLLRRKCREYDNQEQPFSEMTENAQLADWIGRFQYWDAQNHAYIHLNPLQSHDVNLTLQKRYAFLQWEQGSGKTPAAIFTGKHRVEMGAVHSSPIYAFFIRRQILLDLCIIHGADPHVIGPLRLPFQTVDLCRPPFVMGTVIGEKLPLFFLHENLIDRQRSAKAHCIRVIQGDFQNAALYRASHKTAVSASIGSVPARTDLDRHILTGNRKHFFSRRQILHFQQTAFFHFCTASLFTKSMSYHTSGRIFSPSTSTTAI